jgi:hypothetical protein
VPTKRVNWANRFAIQPGVCLMDRDRDFLQVGGEIGRADTCYKGTDKMRCSRIRARISLTSRMKQRPRMRYASAFERR